MTATPASRAVRLRRLASLAAAGALLLGAAACGGDDDDDATTGSGNDSGGGGQTVEITSPSDGDEVDDSGFEVTFSSSEEIGKADDGMHHVHLFYDGDDSEYEVIESDSFTVDTLDDGEHTLKAVLANADHSLTDASDEITVQVGSGGGSGGGGDDQDDDSGGY